MEKIFEGMEPDCDYLGEFEKHIKNNGSFNVLAVIQNLKFKESLPSAYLQPDSFSQDRPMNIAENIRLNFLDDLESFEFLKRGEWTICVSQEGIFNRCLGVSGFSPINKRWWNMDYPNIFTQIRNKSQRYPKVILIINFVFCHEKNMNAKAKTKIKNNVENYDKNIMKNLTKI